MSTTIPCPFQVGDHIHQLRAIAYISIDLTAPPAESIHEIDPSYPAATVIAITERGFTYRYDRRVPHGRAAWGQWTDGGECFPEGYHWWRKVS